MKKGIVIIAIGTFLTSCAGGWSCKKRYCNVVNKKVTTQITTTNTDHVFAQP